MHPVPAGKEQITMRGISRTNRWGSVLTGLAEPWRQPSPPDGTDNGARDTISADMSPAEGWPSFRRIVPIPFTAWLAALDSWQLTKRGGQLRLGQSLLRGPAEHDRHFRTCYIEARLARGPLRPPVRMRLGIDQWSATSTALELIPCRNIRPSPAYLRAGRALLDCLTHALPAQVPVDVAGGRVGADQAWAPAGLMGLPLEQARAPEAALVAWRGERCWHSRTNTPGKSAPEMAVLRCSAAANWSPMSSP